MVAGGFKIGLFNDRSYIEVIHLINPNLSFTFQDKRLSKLHMCNGGGILQNQILICGGLQGFVTPQIYENDIVVLGQQSQPTNNKLLESRGYSKSVVLNDEKIWIIGGRQKNTTEFVFPDQSPIKGPDMPFTLSSHEVIKVDEKRIFILGGYQNGKPSNKTWIVDPTNNFDVEEGPLMNTHRLQFSGSTLNIGAKKYILVAGGHRKVAGSKKYYFFGLL